MATLQKIRSKGPLLLVVIGIALLAFIAGDAWKVLQPHQVSDVGEVNGEQLSVREFQKMVEEYSEVMRLSQNNRPLSDAQNIQARDDVWRLYVNDKLIQNEAEKLGLTVTSAEIQEVLTAGTDPMLQGTPFANPQTGRFDRDLLNNFLVEYARMVDVGQVSEQASQLYSIWSFIEKRLTQNLLARKYQALVYKSLLSNPVEARAAFDARVNQVDMLMAGIPYATIADSTVTISKSELEELYNKKREQFKQYQEARNIKYIDVQVTASTEDRAAIQKEVEDAASQLDTIHDKYASFVRSVDSRVPYVDLFYNKTAFPSDVVARLDSVSVGEVCGPYYNSVDNTINSFKIVAKATAPDSIEFRQLQVYAGDPVKLKTLSDSIYDALKGGADFKALAEKYGQSSESMWLVASQYEGAQIVGDDLKFLSALTNAKVNELINLPIGQVNVILQVTNRKAMKEKYKVAIVKREVEFSKETYNRAYNDFSQFIASNPTLEQLEANAEEAGYSVLERRDLYSNAHTIGGVQDTEDALRWLFTKAKPGEVSELYECGENDHMMVVALVDVIPEGYRVLSQVEDVLRAELLKDKKAEKIMADMKAANASSIEQYKSMQGAVSDSLKLVTFSAPAYVPSLRSSEPLISAYASVAEENKLSNPVKGNAGVYVLQMYSKETLNEEYNEKDEEAQQANTNMRIASRLLDDLYLDANVKDNRYLFY